MNFLTFLSILLCYIQGNFFVGDDCISIGDGTYDVNASKITCGPGHGISIGSLGKDGTRSTAEMIHVKDSFFIGTKNGARIKTWQ
ncbi:hypothetical protein AMTR_s00146p00011810, partial [Amborella trichopoda]